MRFKILLAITLVLLVATIAMAQRNNGRGNRNRGNNRNTGNRNNGRGNRGNRNNGRGNPGNGNSGNQYKSIDCLSEKQRGTLQNRFSAASMAAICERYNHWMHLMAGKQKQSLRPSSLNSGMQDMEQRIADILHKPLKPHEATSSKKSKPRPRKEYRTLTVDERNRYHNGMNVLKNFRIGGTNIYDFLADYHQPHIVPGAHWGAAFLPWHKQYLLMMERLLQIIDPSIMIPYWDSTLDSHLGDQAANSVMWSSEFMGNRFGDVTTGPFAGWTVPRPTEGKYTLWRGNGSIGRMTTDEDFDYITGVDNYRNLTWHVDPYLEMVHGMPHLWTGGPMGTITAAAFDPLFYTHHAFIDLMWDTQRDRVYREVGREDYEYPGLDDDEVYGVGKVQDPFAEVPLIIDQGSESAHYPPKQLYPFPKKNEDSLDEEYKSIYYYKRRPSCSRRRQNCRSPYLFCVAGIYKCAPKLVDGADCSNFTSSVDPCYKGRCKDGRCEGVSDSDNYLNQFMRYLFTLFQPNFN